MWECVSLWKSECGNVSTCRRDRMWECQNALACKKEDIECVNVSICRCEDPECINISAEHKTAMSVL